MNFLRDLAVSRDFSRRKRETLSAYYEAVLQSRFLDSPKGQSVSTEHEQNEARALVSALKSELATVYGVENP